ncbi:MAG: hypothetical protein WC139_02250 [Candidatus Kapaibacterium sp.]
MLNRISKFAFGLLMLALFVTSISEAQTKKTIYPVFSISPIAGVQFPIGGLNDNYGPSWNAGLEVALAINRETSFFLNGTYYNMPRKSDAVAGPDASYIGITAGPRYVFTSPKVKAKFFLEAGVGVYMYTRKEYTTVTTPSVVVPSESTTNFGVNVGPGAIIPLGEVADLVIKTKVHYSFESGGSGGSRTFVAAVIGVDFKL